MWMKMKSIQITDQNYTIHNDGNPKLIAPVVMFWNDKMHNDNNRRSMLKQPMITSKNHRQLFPNVDVLE